MTVAADRLRDKAKEYELNGLAALDLGNEVLALTWSQMAVVLYEVANALDPLEEDQAA